jgi:hypothetical protein
MTLVQGQQGYGAAGAGGGTYSYSAGATAFAPEEASLGSSWPRGDTDTNNDDEDMLNRSYGGMPNKRKNEGRMGAAMTMLSLPQGDVSQVGAAQSLQVTSVGSTHAGMAMDLPLPLPQPGPGVALPVIFARPHKQQMQVQMAASRAGMRVDLGGGVGVEHERAYLQQQRQLEEGERASQMQVVGPSSVCSSYRWQLLCFRLL